MKKHFILLLSMVIIAACDGVDMETINARLDNLEEASLASVQNQIEQIKSTLGTLQGTQEQLSGYVTTLQVSVGELDGNYNELNSEVIALNDKSQVFADDISALNKAIKDNADNIKQWVEASYATLQQLEALQKVVAGISSDIQTIVSRLNGLDDKTKQIADDLKDATDSLTGELDQCKSEIEQIKNSIKAIQDDLDTVKEQIAGIISSVQSVVVVPDYTDGSVKMTGKSENTIRFEVFPHDAAKNIASLGVSALSLDYVETETKTGSLSNIPISGVSFDGEFLSVTADGSELPVFLYSGGQHKSISLRLRISDEINTRSSGYFTIKYQLFEILPATDICEYSAVLHARVIKRSGDDSATIYGFRHSTNKEDVQRLDTYENGLPRERISEDAMKENGEFSYKAERLASGSVIYYSAFAYNNGTLLWSEIGEFTTLPLDVAVYSNEATAIRTKSARLSGNVEIFTEFEDGFEPGVDFGFIVGQSNNMEDLLANGCVYWNNGRRDYLGQYYVRIDDLTPDTKYYFVACATVNGQNFVSSIRSFTTQQGSNYLIQIDGNNQDWKDIMTDPYVSTASSAYNSKWTTINSVYTVADEESIYMLMEFDKNAFDALFAEESWICIEVYINSDGNTSTGGAGYYFLDACADYVVSFAILKNAGGKYISVDSDIWCGEWNGEPNGSGWDWTESGYSLYFEGAGLDNSVEIKIQANEWSLNISDTFSIGVVLYNKNWDTVGLLPNATCSENNPDGIANMLWVTRY